MSKPWAMLMHRRPQMLEARTAVGSCTEHPGPQYSAGSEGGSLIPHCQAVPPQNLPLDTAQPQTCCCSGIPQNHAALRLEHLATGGRAGAGREGSARDSGTVICGGLPNWFPTTGLGDKRTRYKITGTRASEGLCSGVSGAAGPKPPVARRLRPPTSHRVFKWGTTRAARQRSVRPAVESEPRVFQGTRGTGARSASGRAAEGGVARAAGG